MAAMVLAVLLLEQKHCNLHEWSSSTCFSLTAPPSQLESSLDWVSYLTCMLCWLVFFLLLTQNNRDLFRFGHACPARHRSALHENLCCGS